MAETKKAKRSPDVVAIDKIRDAIKDLSKDQQLRVLNYVIEPLAAEFRTQQIQEMRKDAAFYGSRIAAVALPMATDSSRAQEIAQASEQR